MVKASTDNIAGHRSKYDVLAAHLPVDQVGPTFVGGGDPIVIGFHELELIRSFRNLVDTDVVDVGCGIGRLTAHMLYEPIRSYVGIDIIPEIMKPAVDMAKADNRFRLEIAKDCVIPSSDESADIVVGFSVITHLIDEEVYDYVRESKRVLRSGGIAIYSFFDFCHPGHQDTFFRHASQHRLGHGDMLKFTTKPVMEIFAHRAGFTDVSFIDAGTQLPLSSSGSKLMPPQLENGTFTIGQSVCAMWG